jgi:hypothetical protein
MRTAGQMTNSRSWKISRADLSARLREGEDQVFLVLALVIGALTGVTVVAFILLTERLGLKLYPVGGAPWRRLVLPIGGSLGIGYLLYRYFPYARGSGVPQTKAALYARGGRITMRTVAGKFFLHFRNACQRHSAWARRSCGSGWRGNSLRAGAKPGSESRKNESASSRGCGSCCRGGI